jgi:hypothetical protein
MIESLTAVAWAFSTVKSAALAMPHYYALATPVEISRSAEGGDTNNAIPQSLEANYGLEFKTLTPDKPVKILKEGKTEFEMGIRITNISSTPRRFLLSLGKSYFFDESQQRMPFDREGKGNMMSTLDKNNNWIPDEPFCFAGGSGEVQRLTADMRVLKPGESLELFHQASVYREAGEVRIFYYSGGYYCRLVGFKSGRYLVSMHTLFSVPSADNKAFWGGRVQAIPNQLELVEE